MKIDFYNSCRYVAAYYSSFKLSLKQTYSNDARAYRARLTSEKLGERSLDWYSFVKIIIHIQKLINSTNTIPGSDLSEFIYISFNNFFLCSRYILYVEHNYNIGSFCIFSYASCFCNHHIRMPYDWLTTYLLHSDFSVREFS